MGGMTIVYGAFIWTSSHDQRLRSLSNALLRSWLRSPVGPEPPSTWSARSEVRTNDLDGHWSAELLGDPSRSRSVAEGRVPAAPDPPICVAGCLLAILFLASQNRVFGVFAHCRAQRSARAQHPAWIAMAADNYWRVKVRWVTPLGLATASIRKRSSSASRPSHSRSPRPSTMG